MQRACWQQFIGSGEHPGIIIFSQEHPKHGLQTAY
jgi:hypothetical protein